MSEAASMPTDSKIAALHDAYCKATGFDLPMRMGRDRTWFDFDKAGFTKADLLLVINWIRRQIGIARSGYTISSLRFSKLLELDYFEERLQLARMERRSKERKPATIETRQRAGDVERLVEVPVSDAGPVTAGAVGADLLRKWRQDHSGKPLPTS